MTMQVFTTENISVDTLGAAIVVMNAINSEEKLLEHQSIKNVREHGENRHIFTPDLTTITKNIELSLHRGNRSPSLIAITAGEGMVNALRNLLSPSTPDNKPPTHGKNAPKSHS